MRALRIFYRKSDNRIVWYHETRSPKGIPTKYPSTVEQDLAEIPNKMPDGKTPLGGIPNDYNYIGVAEKDIETYFASDTNTIVSGKSVIGKARPESIEVPPEPVMDYKAEILKLKDEVKKLKERA